MMLTLAIRYCLLVFIAVLGVMQAAAAHNNLEGLLFFKYKRYAYLWALLTAGSSLAVFFTWNYHFETGVIEGSQQAWMFAVSAFAALLFTLAVSSLLKYRLGKSDRVPARGLEGLNRSSFVHALRTRYAGKK
jgi:hypothetical protein